MDAPLAAIQYALGQPKFLQTIQQLLDQAEQELYAQQPTCDGCGKCCDFAAMDHRLYASTGELALLIALHSAQPSRPLHCPYQQQSKCAARDQRSLGCRMFFCGEQWAKIFPAIYEKYHQRIRQAHQKEKVEYYYTELTNTINTWNSTKKR